jgi:hypothetical protein
MGNWKPAFELIADDILEKYTEDVWMKDGPGWAELAPSTFKQRMRGGNKGAAILYDSGALSKSFRKGGEDHVETITDKLLQWGSAKRVALFAQTGTGVGFQRPEPKAALGPGRGMPMRKILHNQEEDPQMWADIQSAMLGRAAQIARQAGFRTTGDRGLSPLEARRIGQTVLGVD